MEQEFEYSKEIVVTTVEDERVKEFLKQGWTMDKVTNSIDGLFYVTFKRPKK